MSNDLAVISIDNDPSDFALVCAGTSDLIVTASFRNTGIDPQSNFTVSYQLDSDPVVEETYSGVLSSGQQVSYDFATPLTIPATGSYTLTVSVDLVGDENTSNDSVNINFFAVLDATQLDFSETFEVNGFPPPAWTISNGDNSTTWEERSGVTGSDGNATVTAFIDNYTYNAANEEDIFTTEIFDLTNASSAILTFDLAKAQYSTSFSDGMRVEASGDCGATYEVVYEKDGLDLSTVPGYITSNWTPSSASDWRNESIELNSFLGEYLVIRFVNVNGYGNSTLVDNINVEGVLGVTENELDAVISVYPNPASEQVFVAINSPSFDVFEVKVTTSLGQVLHTTTSDHTGAGTTLLALDVSTYSSGLYFVTIKTGNQSITKKLVVK